MPEHQQVPRHAPSRPSSKGPLLKWLGLATAGALLIGTAPAAGSLPAPDPAAAATSTASTESSPSRTVQPDFAMVAGTSPLRDPSAGSGLGGGDWSPGYQPEITSIVSPDGSPADGEGLPSRRGAEHVTTGPAGLLPGGLALAPPVETTRITSGFGWRLNPTGPGSYIHIGQDYGVACGTPVRAAADGRVVQSAWAGHSGQRVRVDHGSGVETAYSHNSLLVAHQGDRVHRGDLLALSGTTGNSTGCHVHFEVYLHGKWVDPAKYLPRVPGQKRPVSEQELRQIAKSRTSPSPSPTPSRTTTAASSSAPAASHRAAAAPQPSASKSPTAAGPAPKDPTPGTRPRPGQTKESAKQQAPAHSTDVERKPRSSSTKPTPSAPAPSSTPTTTPVKSPSPTPGKPPTKAPAKTPTKTPPAKPTPSAAPTPTVTPTPSVPPTSTPTPTPSPTAGEPSASPDPGRDEPATLDGLCLAYEDEYLSGEEDTAKAPEPPASRVLGTIEMTLLTRAVKAHPWAGDSPDTEEFAAPLTVEEVARHCGEWFPDEVDGQTPTADVSALVKAFIAKTKSTKDTGDTGK
ncbi:peptidoglycan DD-metalloendopeptidase family protein [Arthrobacter sp. 179]